MSLAAEGLNGQPKGSLRPDGRIARQHGEISNYHAADRVRELEEHAHRLQEDEVTDLAETLRNAAAALTAMADDLYREARS